MAAGLAHDYRTDKEVHRANPSRFVGADLIRDHFRQFREASAGYGEPVNLIITTSSPK